MFPKLLNPLSVAVFIITLTTAVFATNISDIPESSASGNSWSKWESVVGGGGDPDTGKGSALEIRYNRVYASGSYTLNYEIRNVGDSKINFKLVFDLDDERKSGIPHSLDNNVFNKMSGTIIGSVKAKVKARATDVVKST